MVILFGVHTGVSINQFNCEPGAAEEILFLSKVLDIDWVNIFVQSESSLDSLVHEDETHGAEVVRKNLDPVGDQHAWQVKVVDRAVKGDECSDCFFGALDS